jgi:hypothetical protein
MIPTPWTLSAHAEVVVQAPGIERSWVDKALDAPFRVEADRAGPSLRHALAAIEEREGRVLRVVYRPSADGSLVVTAYFDRAETRKVRL